MTPPKKQTDKLIAELEKIRQSEEYLRKALKSIGDAVMITDRDGHITLMNRVAEQLTGHAFKQAEGCPVGKILYLNDPATGKKITNPVTKVPATGKTARFASNTILIAKNGSEYPVTASASPIKDRKGNINGVVIVFRDITESYKMREELSEKEEFTKAVMDNLPVGIAVNSVFPEVEALYMNDHFPRIYRTTRKKLTSPGSFWDTVYEDPRFREVIKKRVLDDVASGDPERMFWENIPITRKGKETTYITAYNTPVPEKNLWISVVIDVTDRKRAEDKLRESEAQYRSLIENSNDAIYLLYDRKFDVINHRFEEMFGYTLEEVNSPGFDFIRLVAPESRPLIEERQRKIADGDYVEPMYEFTALNREGKKMNVETSVSYINYKDGKAIQGIIRDVSERKIMMSELVRAKEKAEESDRLKTAFLQNISHEIRTPLNAIVGFSQFLGNAGLPADDQKHYTGIIVQSSKQLLSIITDIMSMATVDAGQEKIRESEVNINDLCMLVYDQFVDKADDRKVSIDFTSKISDKDAEIITDGTKLQQVISNLVGNAVKYTHEGSIKFGYTIKKRHIRFFVEDTGIGIPKEMHQEIFKRFRQAVTSKSKVYGGSGLGLSIAKAYVEIMGGRIWLESEPGIGSRFFFTIPLKRQAEKGLPGEESRGSAVNYDKKRTIMIAEDEDLNYLLLSEFLKDINVEVCRAANGDEAVDICSSDRQVDLILMDIKMPVMDGHEATRKIREFNYKIPIIAQTAYISGQDKESAFESGCNDFLSKPFKKEELIMKVNSLLDRKG